MKTQWRKIHLLGGKPMISNSFGKRVPFVLEPSGLNVPDDCDDNYICGTCVRVNETALRWKGSSRMVHSTVTQQEAINQGEKPLRSMSWLTCFASFLCEFSSWLFNAMYFILQLKKHRLHVVDCVDFFSLSTVCIYIAVFSLWGG